MGKGLLGILILAAITLFMSLIWPFSANQRSAEMGQTIQSALNANGYNFATVNMSGNVARLSGEAPTATAMSAAEKLASATKCEACESKKTWHEVASTMTVKEVKVVPISPYTFKAVKAEDGRVTLDGYVRNEAERTRVLAEAETLFPGMVTNQTVKIGEAGAPNAQWGDAVSMNLTELKLLQRGRFDMENTQTLISGLAANADARTKINAMVGELPSGYNGAANIDVPGTAAMNVGEVKSEGICQTLFNDLKGDNKINFATARADIRGAESYDLLTKLASAANQCSSFRISIVGHTDSDGGDAANQLLSEARANEVVAYLVKNNVERNRMTADGKGETMPVATNDTSEGKAQNRRIEFLVTQAN